MHRVYFCSLLSTLYCTQLMCNILCELSCSSPDDKFVYFSNRVAQGTYCVQGLILYYIIIIWYDAWRISHHIVENGRTTIPFLHDPARKTITAGTIEFWRASIDVRAKNGGQTEITTTSV